MVTTHREALTTASPEETYRLGRLVGEACRGSEVVLLEGDLGAGKTTLAQGLAAGLGVADQVISPTFILLRIYEGRLALYHFDFYRLCGTDRAVDLEFDDYLDAGGVCVIEWPSCAPQMAPPDHLRIALRLIGETARDVALDAAGPRHAALLGRVTARACLLKQQANASTPLKGES